VHLLGAVLRPRLVLVEALQRAVVPFVQPPILVCGDVTRLAVEVEHDLGGPLRAHEVAGVAHVEASFGQLLASVRRLQYALLGQFHIGPAGEAVGGVPH